MDVLSLGSRRDARVRGDLPELNLTLVETYILSDGTYMMIMLPPY